jgi:anti-sigma B factor antagonist
MCDHHPVAGLDVEIQAHAGQAILVLHGDLDMATEAELHDVAMAQLAVQGLAKLGLDLADITFLDSTGVTALLDLRQQANDRGIDMEILAVSRRAARILALVGLAESFGIPTDPDTAPGQSADSDS